MASNEKNIIERYSDGSREEGRSRSGVIGDRFEYAMQFRYTERLLTEYVTPDSKVIEIGCGTGHYGIFLADKCREYKGVDIVPGNIEVFQRKINELNLSNVSAEVGDAIKVDTISDESYDIVLVFGPMYHLPPDERELVFSEAKRICGSGGYVLFYYFNKIGLYTYGFVSEPEKYPNIEKNISILEKGIDDTRDNIFFFTTPEDMANSAQNHGFDVIKNLGVDFSFLIKRDLEITEEKRKAWIEVFDFISKSESCTGFGSHAVMICRK